MMKNLQKELSTIIANALDSNVTYYPNAKIDEISSLHLTQQTLKNYIQVEDAKTPLCKLTDDVYVICQENNYIIINNATMTSPEYRFLNTDFPKSLEDLLNAMMRHNITYLKLNHVGELHPDVILDALNSETTCILPLYNVDDILYAMSKKDYYKNIKTQIIKPEFDYNIKTVVLVKATPSYYQSERTIAKVMQTPHGTVFTEYLDDTVAHNEYAEQFIKDIANQLKTGTLS